MSIKSERQDNFFNVCSQCKGNCCRNAKPPINRKRKKIIEDYLKKQKIPIEDPFVKASYIFPKDDAEGYCIFYDKKTRKCLVHPVKPETCVAGPITFDINIRNQKIEWYLKMEKICPLAEVLHKEEEMLKTHLKSAKEETFKLVCELDSEALKAILQIEEPETFKIDEDSVARDILYKLTSGHEILK